MLVAGAVLIPSWIWRPISAERLAATARAVANHKGLSEASDLEAAHLRPGEQHKSRLPGSRLWGGGKPGWTTLASRDVWEESNDAVSRGMLLALGLFA